MSVFQEPLTESYYYILLCLYKGSNHGYGIMQDAYKLSQDHVKIGSGTMYGATRNMIKKGWIREVESNDPTNRRKRLYELTEDGRKTIENEIKRLHRLIKGADIIINGGKNK